MGPTSYAKVHVHVVIHALIYMYDRHFPTHFIRPLYRFRPRCISCMSSTLSPVAVSRLCIYSRPIIKATNITECPIDINRNGGGSKEDIPRTEEWVWNSGDSIAKVCKRRFREKCTRKLRKGRKTMRTAGEAMEGAHRVRQRKTCQSNCGHAKEEQVSADATENSLTRPAEWISLQIQAQRQPVVLGM